MTTKTLVVVLRNTFWNRINEFRPKDINKEFPEFYDSDHKNSYYRFSTVIEHPRAHEFWSAVYNGGVAQFSLEPGDLYTDSTLPNGQLACHYELPIVRKLYFVLAHMDEDRPDDSYDYLNDNLASLNLGAHASQKLVCEDEIRPFVFADLIEQDVKPVTRRIFVPHFHTDGFNDVFTPIDASSNRKKETDTIHGISPFTQFSLNFSTEARREALRTIGFNAGGSLPGGQPATGDTLRELVIVMEVEAKATSNDSCIDSVPVCTTADTCN
jgi:hypothetical protein